MRDMMKARKCTGGKAPRKMLWTRAGHRYDPMDGQGSARVNEEDFDLVAAADFGVQTYASTSDNQVQCAPELKNQETQTNEKVSIRKLERDLKAVHQTNEYLKDENVLLRQEIGRKEKLVRELIGQKTSLCLKDCCKNGL